MRLLIGLSMLSTRYYNGPEGTKVPTRLDRNELTTELTDKLDDAELSAWVTSLVTAEVADDNAESSSVSMELAMVLMIEVSSLVIVVSMVLMAVAIWPSTLFSRLGR